MSRRAGDAGPVGGAVGLTGSGPGLRPGLRPRFQSHKPTAVRRSKRSERGSNSQNLPAETLEGKAILIIQIGILGLTNPTQLIVCSLTTMPKGSHAIETFRD